MSGSDCSGKMKSGMKSSMSEGPKHVKAAISKAKKGAVKAVGRTGKKPIGKR